MNKVIYRTTIHVDPKTNQTRILLDIPGNSYFTQHHEEFREVVKQHHFHPGHFFRNYLNTRDKDNKTNVILQTLVVGLTEPIASTAGELRNKLKTLLSAMMDKESQETENEVSFNIALQVDEVY